MLIFKSAPLEAVQLLLINLLTDCAPAISISMEKAEEGIMKTKPLSSLGRIFDIKSISSVIAHSVFISLMTLIAYSIGNNTGNTAVAMTMAFATLGFSQIFHVLNCKFMGSIFNKQLFANKFMNYSVFVTLFIIMFLIFTPVGFLFGFNIISFGRFLTCLALSVAIIPFSEVLKFILSRIKE